MVATSEPAEGGGRDPARDRAQLILVGSIAIAVVLVGLTIVLNSAVYTENVAGGSSVDMTDDVTEFDREAVRNVRSLTVRVNHGETYDKTGSNDLKEHVRSNVSTYSQVLAESYADTRSVYVNVTVEDVDEMGTRIVQEEDSNFSDSSPPNPPNPPPSWSTVDGPFQLGWFVANFDVENVSRSPRFYVSLTNTTHELNVSVRKDANNRLQVNSSIGDSHVSNATCAPENGRVLLDLKDGNSYTGDCSFNSTAYLEPPYQTLKFENGGAVSGRYDVVVNRSSPPHGVGPGCTPAPHDWPCRADAVWSLNFTTRYQTGSITHERTHNVSVYDP